MLFVQLVKNQPPFIEPAVFARSHRQFLSRDRRIQFTLLHLNSEKPEPTNPVNQSSRKIFRAAVNFSRRRYSVCSRISTKTHPISLYDKPVNVSVEDNLCFVILQTPTCFGFLCYAIIGLYKDNRKVLVYNSAIRIIQD